jgi:caa(3)-type oxidase subunit IV
MSDHITPHDTAMTHDEHGAAAPHDHRKDYFKIFLVLTVLTFVEVGVTFLKMPKPIVATLLVGLACTKAAYVGLYFMHLKYEKRSLLWLAAVPFPLAGLYAAFLMLDAHGVLRALTLPWK